MKSWVFEGALLPQGEPGRVQVGSGEPEVLPGRFALPGLVDAHCHLTVGADDLGPLLVDKETAERRLQELAEQGVTALRDTGGDRTITLTMSAETRDGWPVMAACGRFFSSAGRYFPRMHEPVAARDLLPAIHDEIDAGATWIKLIGDFPETDDVTVIKGSGIAPAYDIGTVTAAIRAAHDRGVRVAAHTNSAVVSELVSAGVDSVEHGTVITADDIEALGSRHGAWTPTLSASVTTKPTDSEHARRRRLGTSEYFTELLPLAVRAGVRVLAGSDGAGTVAKEISLLVQHGLPVEAALAAASTSAQEYLGIGGDGDLVTCHQDPREDPSTLGEPAAVVVRGLRIR